MSVLIWTFVRWPVGPFRPHLLDSIAWMFLLCRHELFSVQNLALRTQSDFRPEHVSVPIQDICVAAG